MYVVTELGGGTLLISAPSLTDTGGEGGGLTPW